MKFVLIVGDGAVGKMTVGQELSKITDLKLFHNHMTIEPVIELMGKYDFDLIMKLRFSIFEHFAKSDNYGMIYTCMWAYDVKEDWEIMEKILKIFKSVDANIYCVELTAPLSIRLERNKTENRLKNKPSKLDLEKSEARLIKDSREHRFVSYDGEVPIEDFLRVENSDLSPKDVALMIKKHFNL